MIMRLILICLALALSLSRELGMAMKISSIAGQEVHGSCPEDSNFRTAHKLQEPLPFCSEYDDRSCCDATQAEEIRETTYELVRPKCAACFRMVREWKCSECHPKAGDFYIGARASIRFCKDYCHAVFEHCKDIPLDLERGYFYLNTPDDITAEEWCQGRVGLEGQCFNGTLPTESEIDANDECVCEEHDCHDEATKQFDREQEVREQSGKMPWDEHDEL